MAMAALSDPPRMENVSGVGGGVPKTVLRLKRRLEESPPPNVLVMSYKRLRHDGDEVGEGEWDEEIRKVFRHAGTVAKHDSDDVSNKESIENSIKEALAAVEHAREIEKGRSRLKARRSIKDRNHSLRDRNREDTKKTMGDNRFKVVAQKRGISGESGTDGANQNQDPTSSDFLFNLLDLVAENEDESLLFGKKRRNFEPPKETAPPGSVTVNGIPMLKESNPQPLSSLIPTNEFVYYLYVANDIVAEEQIHDQLVSVRPADDDYEFDCNNSYNSDEEFGPDDEEDSNDEGNWRNDYPDSDPDGEQDGMSYGYDGQEDDEFASHFAGVSLKQGDESSSDGDDDGYLYGGDYGDDGMGGLYNQYKARLRMEEELAEEVVSSATESDCD